MRLLPLLLMLTFILGCKDDDDNCQGVDCLPPATQTGANTFGCLLDGEVFLPRKLGNNPLDCVYQFVDGGYYFTLYANNRDRNGKHVSLTLSTNSLEIEENVTYSLLENVAGNATGRYFYNTKSSYTSSTYTGELTITHLDEEKQIVSGTFWFDVEDTEGVVHLIREGRFDMQL